MTIEPCGKPEAAVVALREAAYHLEGCAAPPFILERGSGSDYRQCLVNLLHCPSCKPCTEMCRLHSTGTSARHHQRVVLCEHLAQQHHLTELGIGAQQRVASHHTHHAALVVVCKILVEMLSYSIVVQRTRQHLLFCLGVLATCYIVVVHLLVKAVLILACTPQPHLVVQCLRRVETLRHHVVRHALHILQHALLLLLPRYFIHSRLCLVLHTAKIQNKRVYCKKKGKKFPTIFRSENLAPKMAESFVSGRFSQGRKRSETGRKKVGC